MDEFLTVIEVAKLLKVNPQTVRNWIDQGKLPAVSAGRRVRIRQSDFDQFLEPRPTMPTDAASVSVQFAVAVYSGREPEGIFGPFDSEEQAVDWCREEGVDVGSSPRAEGRRRGFVLPFAPAT